jgi:hypothetical protein
LGRVIAARCRPAVRILGVLDAGPWISTCAKGAGFLDGGHESFVGSRVVWDEQFPESLVQRRNGCSYRLSVFGKRTQF